MHPLLERALSATRYRADRHAQGPVIADVDLAGLAAAAGRPLRVAVARFDGIGDWILCLPLVTALTRSEHVGSVRLVGPPGHASMLDTPLVDGYERYTRGTILHPPAPGGVIGKIRAVTWDTGRRAFADGEASGPYDLVVLPRWDTDLGQNARAWAAGTGAPVVGFDPTVVPTATPRERRERSLLSAPVVDADESRHEIRRAQELMHALGLDDAVAPGYGREFFGVEREEQPGPDGRPVVVLHTSSVELKRRWPGESWSELIDLILTHTEFSVALSGAPGERDDLEVLRRGREDRVQNLAGAPLSELPRTMAHAHAFIGNDSGPMHVASAVDIPVVGISPHPLGGDPAHRNAPERFGPWATSARLLRPAQALSPCSGSCSALTPHCITQITPHEVFAALLSVTGGSAGADREDAS